MERVNLSRPIYHGSCACWCGCEVGFGPSSSPIWPGTLCDDCGSAPIGECPVCLEEHHIRNYGVGIAGEGDLICCDGCLEEVQRVGVRKPKEMR